MAKHQCNYEKEIATIAQKLVSIEKNLFGNGVKGLVTKMEETVENVNKIKNYTHIRNWVLGGAVTVLASVCGFLLSQIYYLYKL